MSDVLNAIIARGFDIHGGMLANQQSKRRDQVVENQTNRAELVNEADRLAIDETRRAISQREGLAQSISDLANPGPSGQMGANPSLIDIAQGINATGIDLEAPAAQQTFLSATGLDGSVDTDQPAAVREWQYFQNLPREQKQEYLGLKRQGWSLTDVGGVPTFVNSITGQSVPLSNLENEVRGAAAISGGQESAQQAAVTQALPQQESIRTDAAVDREIRTSEAERVSAAPEAIRKADQQIRDIDNVLDEARVALDKAGFLETGFIGSVARNISGTDAFDVREAIKTVQSALSKDELQKMRDNSKTGGALGNVTERELDLLSSAIASLDQGKSEDEFVRSLQKVITHYENYKQIVTDLKTENEGRVSGDTPKSGNIVRVDINGNPL